MKTKTHFTRKNFIALALVYFYVLVVVITALLLDGKNPIGIKENANLILKIGSIFSFQTINGSAGAYILLFTLLIYMLLFVTAFIYEMRLAKYYENKIFKKKWVLIYVATFLICLVLGLGIGLVAQYPYNPTYIKNSFLFLLQAMLIGLLIFVIISSIIVATVSLVINIKNIDKPFFFSKKRVKDVEEMEDEREVQESIDKKKQGDLAQTFGENPQTPVVSGVATGAGQLTVGDSLNVIPSETSHVFPGLTTIDLIVESEREKIFNLDGITLKRVCEQFRKYLAKNHSLYFSISTIRQFIASLSASRLVILEGLSGTGKSSLARYFPVFLEEEAYFESVQATWRDRSALLGYFNDFSKKYNETDFLKHMYHMTFKEDRLNVMVLDEVNISRVEYYFADFLSVLEYPMDMWKLKIMQIPYGFETPKHLNDGVLKIPHNTWFIATANKDDSTFTITDKVYDRAMRIKFDTLNEPFIVNEDIDTLPISYEGLTSLFDEAYANSENRLDEEDLNKFKLITDFTYETFEITFGNRVYKQMDKFIATFVECGGSKEDGLDFIYSSKIISKLDGRFEEYIKQGLIDLKHLIEKTYGKTSFVLTIREINKLIRKL